METTASMYGLLLMLHSWGRWLVLILLMMLASKAYRCWKKREGWTRHDHLFRAITIGVFDLQFVLGLLLYFFYSPLVKTAFEPNSNFMTNPHLRFFALEHFFGMFIAIVVLHFGSWMSKRAEDTRVLGRRLWITLGTTVLIVAISIPWPFLPYGRGLFRLG